MSSNLGAKQAGQQAIFACIGEFWTIGYSTKTFTLGGILGLSYLERLLRHPGEEFHAADLVKASALLPVGGKQAEAEAFSANLNIRARPEGDGGEMLDLEAKRDYRRKLAELSEELQGLRERGNVERAEEVESEIDFLTREIKRAVGLGGRDRRMGSASERARLNVTRAIRSALAKISEHDSALGKFLGGTVRTGTFCCYKPSAQTAVHWRFSSEETTTTEPVPLASPSPARETTFLRSLIERTTFVGRNSERGTLRRLLEQAQSRAGKFGLIGGTAGVGKTRLAAEVAVEAMQKGFLVYPGACYDREHPVPFSPFVEILEAALAQSPSPDAFRVALGEDAGELARLMPQLRRLFPEIPAPPELQPEQSRRTLFKAVAQTLSRTAGNRPVLLLLDDLQWADEGTLLLLGSLARLIQSLPVLILGTFRDFELDIARPLAATIDELIRPRLVELIRLEGLSEPAVAEMLEALSGRNPPSTLVTCIHSDTEGNPFFIEELFWYLAEQGKLFDAAGEFRDIKLQDIDLPHTVRIAVGRRLRRLSDGTRRALAAAAIIGHSFTFDLLQACDQTDSMSLLDSVEEAEKAGLIYSGIQYPDVRFSFTHELIRRVVIGELSIQRSRLLHRDIAQAIERIYAGTIEDHAEDLAHHLWQAGTAAEPTMAVRYLTLAAKRAREQGAYEVARHHLTNALESLRRLPASQERARHELELTLGLSAILIPVKGYAATELKAPIARMLELCEQIDDQTLAFWVKVQIWANVSVVGDHAPGALGLSERLMPMSESSTHPLIAMWANVVRGVTCVHTGQFVNARTHLEQAIALRQPQMDASPGGFENPVVLALVYLAQDLWFLGYPDLATRRVAEAADVALEVRDPHGLAHAYCFAALIHLLRHEPQLAIGSCDKAIDLSNKHGMTLWLAMGLIWRGLALLETNGVEHATLQLMEGISTYVASGAFNGTSYWMTLKAEADLKAGNLDEATALVEEASTFIASHGEGPLEAETHRLRGEILLMRSPVDIEEATNEFNKAIAIARARSAKSLELRAATSLARLWNRQGKHESARRILSEIYGWFSEGVDTGDLKAAAGLLEELRHRPEQKARK